MTTDTLDEAVTGTGLVSAYQQVVTLPSETVVGYEALARWPKLDNPSPIDVFARAQQTGRLNTLDGACIRAAVRGALLSTSTPGMLLLINCEPATSHVDLAQDDDVRHAASRFRLTFEVTERGLLINPRALLRKVTALRSLGFAIALDDIGSHPDSLVLLDVLTPEILKLDMGLIQHQPDRMQARTVAAITAHHERTGAVICAEGIETEDHLEQALAYGATLGQGMRFGGPGELPHKPQAFSWPARKMQPAPTKVDSAKHGLAEDVPTTRIVRKDTVTELARHIGRIAVTAETPPMILFTLKDTDDIHQMSQQNLSIVAERSPLVAVFGQHLPEELGPRVRQVRLDPDDPLTQESAVLVLGPDTAAALIARERTFPGCGPDSDEDRRYEMSITFDRARVTAAARSLLDRLE
ncbi:MAG: EAL domain-containing protein [Actinomycetota bacterium]|uniref:EAL domain-containing protein n=1 Tax=Mycobacterium lentiflavum TaxID=141349 RepID=A0ABY3USU4_MYCLN|nr:EAL domain-containing protein [Mycobacterium lentiflavum]MEE3063355.1 EAL domain-containing protein [Actinomycetota bacterium]ULP41679.1 EAL domain-containing protein [Mycobacterium lentiflavum]